MKHYCLGFLFDHTGEHVALILKDHPARQHGKLNGIGGKIADGELRRDAMARKFKEETGLLASSWQWFGQFGSEGAVTRSAQALEEDWLVELYRATWPGDSVHGVMPPLRAERSHNEKPCWVRVDDAVIAALWGGQCWAGSTVGPKSIMRNLSWLLPLARDTDIVGAALIDGGEAAT